VVQGLEIKVTFLKHLRDEIAYAKVEDLIAQLHRDVREARSFFGEE